MKYCLIGEKLGHSYSKFIHEKLGLDYILNEIPKDKVTNFFENCDFDGFNVTIPYKKEAIPFMSYLSDDAKLTGVVNTVYHKDGKLYGYNTDIGGMEYMINSKNISLKDKNVLILGSGGTSNTCQALCKKQGAKKVTVVSRTGSVNYSNCHLDKGVEIIINTTPVGMYPNIFDSPIDLTRFSNLIAVFDCIYNPKNTKLITQAKSLNLICGNGFPMLVRQAILANEIWTGKKYSQEITEKLIVEISKMTNNLVLIGMPSSGKTTLGKKLAKKLNKEFVDSDEEFVKEYNITPSQCILFEGEDVFRDKECLVIKNLSKKVNSVISLGGGSILRQENIDNVKLNGVVCYIKRDLSLLEIKNRPLSQKDGVENLFNKRKLIYEKACDFSVENNDKLSVACEEILKKYENSCN